LEIASVQQSHHKSVNNIPITHQILPNDMKVHANWIGFMFVYFCISVM